jgi:hypothetical protein
MNELEETAKATQEVAKTTNTAIKTIKDFGNYMSKFLTPPLEQVSELITDKLKYYTFSNQLNLMKKAQEKMDELGLSPKNTIPLKLGIPLLEAASLEDDDRLQELWANLLVNSSTSFSLERSFISVLEQLSPLEAKILIMIYKEDDISDKECDMKKIFNKLRITEDSFALALSNLRRLGCIDYLNSLSGEIYSRMLFGAKLYEAVKEPTN